jgi:deoxycytidylate deaminase
MKLSKSHRAYFNAAKAISELSDYKQKVGCVVVMGHRIISSGCNSQSKCHAVQARLNKENFGYECPGFVHAEIDALRPLLKRRMDLSKASVYVYRQRKDGSLGLARPCGSCMSAIRALNIRNVYYTNEGGYSREEILY